MGHGSARAALLYQHATQQRDTMIADVLSLSTVERDRARTSRATPDGRRDQAGDHGSDLGFYRWSGRRESNSRNQFGRLRLYH